jgi:hypothetical protein
MRQPLAGWHTFTPDPRSRHRRVQQFESPVQGFPSCVQLPGICLQRPGFERLVSQTPEQHSSFWKQMSLYAWQV